MEPVQLSAELLEKLSQSADRVMTMATAMEELGKRQTKLEEMFGRAPKRRDVVPGLGAWSDDSPNDGVEKKQLFLQWARCIWAKKTFPNTPDFVKKALDEGVDAEGGYLVPEIFIPELQRVIQLQGVMRPLVRKIPMATDTSNLPSLASSMTAYWPGELQIITQSDPAFGKVTLNLKTMAALTSASVQLEEDSQLALADLIITLFGEVIAAEEDKQILAANAAPFTGWLFGANVNVVTMGTGLSAFSDISWLDYSDLINAVVTTATRNAVFIQHRNITNYARKIRDLNHNFIWAPPTGGQKGPGTIWGYNIVESETMPASGDTAASKAFVCFGDPQRIFLGERGQYTVARSNEVGFRNLETFWRVTERIAVAIGTPTGLARVRTAA